MKIISHTTEFFSLFYSSMTLSSLLHTPKKSKLLRTRVFCIVDLDGFYFFSLPLP